MKKEYYYNFENILDLIYNNDLMPPFFDEESEEDMGLNIKRNNSFIVSKNKPYKKFFKASEHCKNFNLDDLRIKITRNNAYLRSNLINKNELININAQHLIDCEYSKIINNMIKPIIISKPKRIIYCGYKYSEFTGNSYFIYGIKKSTFPEWSKHWFRPKDSFTYFKERKFQGNSDNKNGLIKLLLKVKKGYPLSKRQQEAFDLMYLGYLEEEKLLKELL